MLCGLRMYSSYALLHDLHDLHIITSCSQSIEILDRTSGQTSYHKEAVCTKDFQLDIYMFH